MSTTDHDAVTVPFFKKKGKSRPTTSRKRSASPHLATSDSSKTQVVLPSKKGTGSLLSAGTKRTLSQRESLYENDAEEEGDSVRRDGPDVKWTAENSHRNAVLDIIAGDEIDEVLAKRRKAEHPDGEDDVAPDDGQYHGQAKYKSHIQKSKEVPKAMRVGPQRNTSTIRTVTIVDYQPDVCKDYKETGYCGFGDTCKFLHDRGTYLAGWQIDKQWDAQTAAGQQAGSDSSDDSDDEDIPFGCLICRKPYTDPIVTRCGHYFCSACAIKRFAKTPKCIACGAPTGGIFNKATKVLERIEKKKKKNEGENDEEGASGDESKTVEIEGLDNDEDSS